MEFRAKLTMQSACFFFAGEKPRSFFHSRRREVFHTRCSLNPARPGHCRRGVSTRRSRWHDVGHLIRLEVSVLDVRRQFRDLFLFLAVSGPGP